MKNLVYFIFSGILSLSILSCSEVEPDVYAGDSYLNFNKGTTINESVLIDTDYKDFNISFGTISAVNGNHQVKLIFDAAKSTAILGVDFNIINDTDELVTGDVGGAFPIRLVEPAQGVVKTAVFRLQSATLPYAMFDQELVLTWRLQCTIQSFLGGATSGFFDAKSGLFTGNFPGPVEIILGSEPNTIVVKDYLEVGYDLKLKYDESGRITFDPQQTGYIHPTYGMISIKMSSDGAPSSYDACNREMTLKANYFVSAGTFGDMTDTFVGL